MKRNIFSLLFMILLITPALVFAAETPPCGLTDAPGTTTLFNPLSFIGVCTPGELVTKVVQGFAAILGATAVAFMVFAGFKLVVASSSGNEESVAAARENITWTVGGFIITMLSFVIVSGAAKILGFRQENVPVGEDKLASPIYNFSGENLTNFWVMLDFVVINFLGLVGVVTILLMIYHGYRYMAAAGEEEAVVKAKTGMKWSLIGFAVSIMAFAIIYSIQRLVLNF